MRHRIYHLLRGMKPTNGRDNLTPDGYLDAWGHTVPTDGDTGYAPGCTFKHTDSSGATALYVNRGDSTSCNFDAST